MQTDAFECSLHIEYVLKHLHDNCNKQLMLVAVQELDFGEHASHELHTNTRKRERKRKFIRLHSKMVEIKLQFQFFDLPGGGGMVLGCIITGFGVYCGGG